MSWVGMGLDTSIMRFVPGLGHESAEFLFAVIDPPEKKKQGKLDLVDTVDNTKHGITIRMYDFPGGEDSVDRSRLLQSYLSNSGYLTGDSSGGKVTRNLVLNRLDGDGFPVNAKDGKQLSELFSSAYGGQVANHLFIQSIYDETGYYEYDGGNNYAYLAPGSGDFQVYRQIARPKGALDNAYVTKPTSAVKGNFMPYNSLEDTPDKVWLVNDETLYDGDGVALDESDPRYQKDLYHLQDPDYFFGMTLEAGFYQPKGGLVDGEAAVFEFNGDDDMWVFVDDVMILDIGGIHGPVRGTINFKTGIAYVSGSNGYTKTLGELFHEAGVFPDGSAWDDNRAGYYFKLVNIGGTLKYGPFQDYTGHMLKYFYLERGAGASNLRVRFNTPSRQPSAFVLEKQMPEEVQAQYSDAVYAFIVSVMGQNPSTGAEELQYYFPPMDRPVYYEGSGEVAFDSSWGYTFNGVTGYWDLDEAAREQRISESRAVRRNVRFGDNTFYVVYYLHPGESLVFPVEDESVEYTVWEIAIDTGEIKKVEINDVQAAVYPVNGASDSADSMAMTSVSTVKNRGRVVYNNIPRDNQVGELRITKFSESAAGDDATFSFNVKLEDNLTGELVPYFKGEYYVVKEVDGADHYFRYAGQELVDNGDVPFAYYAGVSGSISNIPVGYSILIKNLLAGTDFYVEERFNDLEGYTHIRTEVENGTAGVGEATGGTVVSQGTIVANATVNAASAVEAKVNVTNRPTGRLIAEKAWADAGQVTAHGDVMVALFEIQDTPQQQLIDGEPTDVTVRAYRLVEGSVRPFYDEALERYRVEYYLPEAALENHVVREVKAEYDGQGQLTSVTPVLNDGWITVSGERMRGGASDVSNTYVVNYQTGTTTEYAYHVSLDDQSTATRTGHIRTDTITNTLPKFSARKVNMDDATLFLNGAEFTLTKVIQNASETREDASFAAMTFTSSEVSGDDGVIFEDLCLSEGTYLLTETKAPAGYNLLTKSVKITVSDGGLSVGYSDGSSPGNLNVSGTTDIQFLVPNAPGARLPNTGGTGTAPSTLLGLILILAAIVLLLRQKTER